MAVAYGDAKRTFGLEILGRPRAEYGADRARAARAGRPGGLRAAIIRTSSRAGCASASTWRARWRSSRRCSCWTSRSPRSTRRRARSCSSSCCGSGRRAQDGRLRHAPDRRGRLPRRSRRGDERAARAHPRRHRDPVRAAARPRIKRTPRFNEIVDRIWSLIEDQIAGLREVNRDANGDAARDAVARRPGRSARIADYLADFRLPTQPRSGACASRKHVLLDSLGCMIAGARTPSGRAATALARECRSRSATRGRRPPVAVRTSPRSPTRSRCNALDFESVGPEGHMGAVAVPTALAVAEWRARSGRRAARCGDRRTRGRRAHRRGISPAVVGRRRRDAARPRHAARDLRRRAPAALLLGLDRERRATRSGSRPTARTCRRCAKRWRSPTRR